jgi:hypothetical protein
MVGMACAKALVMKTKQLTYAACLLLTSTCIVSCAESDDDPGPGPLPSLGEEKADSAGSAKSLCPGKFDAMVLVPNALSKSTCVAVNDRNKTFVKFAVTGTENTQVDTRQLRYRLNGFENTGVLSNQGVYFFGTQLGFLKNGGQRISDDLSIAFWDVNKFEVSAGMPFSDGVELDILMMNVKGPGHYTADGSLSMSRQRDKPKTAVVLGHRYAIKGGCQVDVSVSAAGETAGTFRCTLPGKNIAGDVQITGEFFAPANGLANLQIASKIK